MQNKSRKLTINLLTSKIFYSSPPLIIRESKKRGHDLFVFQDKHLPELDTLLNCDVYIDYSSITDVSFYSALEVKYRDRCQERRKVPLMVDPPSAIINSLDKRRTHAIFPKIVPESYNLDGFNNSKFIRNFIHDKYVVIKDPMGWQSERIERLSPEKALKKHGKTIDLIVQKYIPVTEGVGRVLILNHGSDIEIICAYLRIPRDWKTDEGQYRCKLISVNKDLHDFALFVSKKSRLYLNGIDYIYSAGKYFLLEVNAAPGLLEPFNEFKINTVGILFDHIERNITELKIE